LVFAQSFSKIIVPRACVLGISLPNASRDCSVYGDFADERSTLAYCIGYAWDHYASFGLALDTLGLKPREFGYRPLVIDLGCGPGTAMVAFGEWLHRARQRVSDVRYIGIDRSAQMRRLAAAVTNDDTLFKAFEPILIADSDELASKLETQVEQRDEIVLTMSYVLHQQFMADGKVLCNIMRDLCAQRRPIWILAQDANKPHQVDQNVIEWPDTRFRALVNTVEAYGYRARV
jgi:SAM-dependent methyltransferase